MTLRNIKINLGAMSSPIEDQLRAQGLQLDMSVKQRGYLQRDADEVSRLYVRCILTDTEATRARQRIFRIVQKQAIPVLEVTP